MAAFDSPLCEEYIEESTFDRKLLVRSNSKWKSSSETLGSQTNSNDMVSFSADDATSESEFDEHTYSIPKRIKTLNTSYCKKSAFQPRFTINKSKKIMSEDNEDFDLSRPTGCPMDRHTSNDDVEINSKQNSKTRRRVSKCESKNAVMARLNRLKKKKYVADLELRNTKLKAENESLKIVLAKTLKEVSSLKRETINLHSVIKNSTEIGSLLQCVQKNTNLHVTSSLLKKGSSPHLTDNMSDKTTSRPCASRSTTDELTNNDEGMINEINLFHCGNQSTLTKTNPSGLPSEHSDIDEISDFNFDINPSDIDLLSDFKGEVSSDCFFNAYTSSKTESKISDLNELVRCETPSKDIDISISNNDLLFDDVGVCFHIANKRVSLEFCESCNRKAAIWSD